MALRDLQSVLARLYTDSAFRARFFDGSEAARGLGLTIDEQQSLAALDRAQVERFARSLQQKRLGLVRELLPATAALLGETFAARFFEYCDRQPSAREPFDEALAFLDHLSSELPGSFQASALPAYWPDLLTCERLRLELMAGPSDSPPPKPPALSIQDPLEACPRRTAGIRIAAFGYDMETLYPQLTRGEVSEAGPEPCFLLIAKPRTSAGVRMKRINAPSAQMLALCDGTRKLGAIIAEVGSGLALKPDERPAFAAECLRFLAPLTENGLIQ
jgi:hypothetical protein